MSIQTDNQIVFKSLLASSVDVFVWGRQRPELASHINTCQGRDGSASRQVEIILAPLLLAHTNTY